MGPNIREVLRQEKKFVEDALAAKAFDIVRRFTQYARLNLEPWKLPLDPRPPRDLGDYDVLAFLPEKGIVLNIECKDLLPPFCLKDARRLRDKVFGRSGKDNGYLGHVERRQSYLKAHIMELGGALGWPVSARTPPRPLAVYVSHRTDWCTRFPPRETEVSFTSIDLLGELIARVGP